VANERVERAWLTDVLARLTSHLRQSTSTALAPALGGRASPDQNRGLSHRRLPAPRRAVINHHRSQAGRQARFAARLQTFGEVVTSLNGDPWTRTYYIVIAQP